VRCLFYLALTVAGLSAPSTTLPYLLEHPFFSAFIAYHANQQRLSYCKDLTAIRSSDTLFSRRRTAFLGGAGCNSTTVVWLFFAINQCVIVAFPVRRKQFVRGCLSVLCHCISWNFEALANVVYFVDNLVLGGNLRVFWDVSSVCHSSTPPH